MDVTLYGDSLREWKTWVASLKREENWLRVAMTTTKLSVLGSLPFSLLAVLLLLPLTFLDILTFHLFCAPLRMLLAPLIGWIRTSSALWPNSPFARPFLIMPTPIVILMSMVLINLIPQEADVRATRDALIELWPLTERRLEWIATRGNGKIGQEATNAAH